MKDQQLYYCPTCKRILHSNETIGNRREHTVVVPLANKMRIGDILGGMREPDRAAPLQTRRELHPIFPYAPDVLVMS